MATPLLLKARRRKMIYFGAIVALFGLSLIHREFVVKPQAMILQLREISKGEVELTSSAVRLMLTGSRGLAVTMLWYTAMDKQKRGDHHELELIVASITKLQPYFITPWLFQSWNISFNVAVECDRPRDKYYYISRGLELAGEGERRNSGTGDGGGVVDTDRVVIPGNPELRHWIGFIYQLKIGGSDERLTMRSLLEMSCIDPLQRSPDTFWTTNEKGQKGVNLVEFTKFTQKHPRLIRRLNEQLGYADNPQRIVQFLEDHKNIPNRFRPIDQTRKANIKESELKDPKDQFPILPLQRDGGWPDAQSRDLTNESIDVFLVCRTWYEYAQKPLPPPDDGAGAAPGDYDKLRYRVPKGMVTQLFRGYPARAQVFIAETLESEGWFDSEGWDATKWVYQKFKVNVGEYVFGTDAKYHSRLAWQRGYEIYKKFGDQNGIYLSPADVIDLNQRAELIRKQPGVSAGSQPQIRSEWRVGALGESLKAHMKLFFSEHYRKLANFDAFLYQAEGESDPITVAARKALFHAERNRKKNPSATLDLYAQGWALYTQACFKYPRFAQVSSMQEEIYEIHQKSLRLEQEVHRAKFESAAAVAAKRAYWPIAGWPEAIVQYVVVSTLETDKQEMKKIIPIRARYGSLDLIQYYDGPSASNLKRILDAASHFGLAQNLGIPSTANAFPGHEYYYLTRTTPFVEEVYPADWRPLITPDARRTSLDRLGLTR